MIREKENPQCLSYRLFTAANGHSCRRLNIGAAVIYIFIVFCSVSALFQFESLK